MSDIFEQMVAQHTITGDNDRNLFSSHYRRGSTLRTDSYDYKERQAYLWQGGISFPEG